MSVSLTQLRQQLFELADRVAATGEPLLIERRGVRLRLSRDDSVATSGRLSGLVPRRLVNGPPLRPDESPAAWSESATPVPASTQRPTRRRARKPRR